MPSIEGESKCKWDGKVIWCSKRKAWIREGSSDARVFNEINSYKVMHISSKDVILDIGANIGSFSRLAVAQGAKVISVEPEPKSFSLLCKNSPNSHHIRAAVTSTPKGVIPFYLNRGKGAGSHSTTEFRGRLEIQVKTISLGFLLNKYKPNKLKCDTEGSEYDLFLPCKLPPFVKELIMEIHLTKKSWKTDCVKLHESVLSDGFEAVIDPKFGPKVWTTIAYYRRVK